MASEQDLLANIQLGNYIALVITTAVVYDYVLTLLREIEYIWKKPWTSMSTIFFVVRYIGLVVAIFQALYGTSFMSGPVTMWLFEGTAVFLFYIWGEFAFYLATNLVMTLRVYAMHQQSRVVLGVILTVYIPAIIIYFVGNVLFDNPKTSLSVFVVEVADMKLCSTVIHLGGAATLSNYFLAHQVVLAFLLCGFSLILFIKDSLEETCYISLRINILSYVSALVTLVAANANTSLKLSAVAQFLLIMFSSVLPYVLAPRLIISVRQFHSEMVGKGIDSGFGLRSQRLTANGNDIVFASPEENNEDSS
ncbi:hypothetical protein HYDPIDRAFT_28053 [Hydnomerulius pinastri MD-312]|uniref:DUF6533 domain-containing protein n=1 Tax=Hydnomerulius pinastri MD-312 TaxID=994086 RepID=A0A0C9WG24_9AGAM|nr:hypothetical protein HYDPIDRAFT_28053 [Hydnomerulius pinastri MD-312]